MTTTAMMAASTAPPIETAPIKSPIAEVAVTPAIPATTSVEMTTNVVTASTDFSGPVKPESIWAHPSSTVEDTIMSEPVPPRIEAETHHVAPIIAQQQVSQSLPGLPPKRMESFFGFVSTPLDAAILIHASRFQSDAVLPIKRRLLTSERNLVRSGSVFVFTESDSGMKRWTDGMRWSKSRVEGQFLVYRCIDHKRPVSSVSGAAATSSNANGHSTNTNSTAAAAAPSFSAANATSTTSPVTVHQSAPSWLETIDAPLPPCTSDAESAPLASSVDYDDRSSDCIAVQNSTSAEHLSASALSASDAACLEWIPDVQRPFALGKRSISPIKSDLHRLLIPSRPSSAMSHSSAPTGSPDVGDDYEQNGYDDADLSGLSAPPPLMKRQRTLDNPLPSRLHSAPAMRRQMSTESIVSTSSLASSSGSPYADDTLSKKTFSVKIRGVVSHVICYFTRMDVAAGVLPIPASCPQFSDLVVPREYLDPGNFRLHPKGSVAVQSVILPYMSADLKVAAISAQVANISSVVTTVAPGITPRHRSLAPAHSGSASAKGPAPIKSRYTADIDLEAFPTPPHHTPLACIIAAAASMHNDNHEATQAATTSEGHWGHSYSLPTPPPLSKPNQSNASNKRSIRSRLRSERRVTISHGDSSLFDVPLPLEFQQLHEHISQLFAVPNTSRLRIMLSGLGEICDHDTFSIIHSGDVLTVVVASPPTYTHEIPTPLKMRCEALH
ncbi:hypothetical protein BASA83_010006 [Batrachochytrium salamandrivorans]|nr:hypothetical protein BASA83_010006 [Batrachochytrium salamandrivorans]